MLGHLRPWLEAAYFFSGIVVAIAVAFGLKQIGLLKKDIRVRNERAAKEKAIEYASRYLCDYVRLQGVFFDAREGEKLGPYSGPIGDFTRDSIPRSVQGLETVMKRYGIHSWLPAMNELEAISAAFTSGVADEATGFKIIGRSFCGTVQDHYDLIAWSRHKAHNPQGYWNNIVQLYKMWSPRLEESELRQAKEFLENRIAGIASHTTGISAIGTE